MKKILIIAGTRPEAIKLIPVYFALREEFDAQLISTGQHREMLKQIFDFFQIIPQHALNTMVQNQSLAEITGSLFSSLSKIMEIGKPSLAIVQGDTTTAMVGAMVSYYHQIPVAHVEAGLRSHNIYSPFPEEVNRRIITQIAELNFAPTKSAADNLQGFKNVHIVGNTIVDSLRLALEKVEMNDCYETRFPFILQGKEIVLITAHRRESFGDGIRNICEAVKLLASKYPSLQFVYPVHLNPHVKNNVHSFLGKIASVFLIDPVNYDEMVYLMKAAKIIMTDSGGVQEEAPSLGVPLVVMRDVTERPEGIEAGCAVLGGTNAEGIVRAFEEVYLDAQKYEVMSHAANPYGDGKSSQRIATIIRNFL